jgi:tetratricopeptide (TPR) repeat protein
MKTVQKPARAALAGALLAASVLMAAPSVLADEARPVEAISFGGQPILRTALPADRTSQALEEISALEALPARTELDYVRLGELNASIGRFQDAITAFSAGLVAYPDSYKLRRHRGHRLINVRALDRAIVDLSESVALMPETPEPEIRLAGDAYGSYQHWIWYHVGLYHYLSADYARAMDAYRNAVETAPSEGLKIGSTDWLWNASMRAGDSEVARDALSGLPDVLPDGANLAYANRVRLYRGEVEPGDILDLDKPVWTGGDMTTAYGVANWYAFNGDDAMAQRIYQRVVETPFWSAWAYIAAERELTR